MILGVFIWVVIVVSASQALYLGWRLWPSLWRTISAFRYWLHCKVCCPWCWRSLHIMRWWPEAWSSTICSHHERRILAQVAARRQARAKERQVACG